ncbi:MAG: hypothetical protein PW843_01610 [Azospirillaceae bacterium]|uniref:hypothetical protein n=1 Tax=Nitrospirillum sp. BR 11163 TaxID=3104323 RepID=UPI0023899257|nr:hypothetical protein [Nitrospirillum sp. BR 11163]MDE1145298.1 hypothetical protein [Azospirillaceae bacterium]MEA1674408.1 hypothetical protein [Nitrospirillum sp. BR 11163]
MVLSRRGVEPPKPGEWMEEVKLPKRRLLVHAIHQRAGHPPHVEFLVDGRSSDRLSLALEVVLDSDRFRRMGVSQNAA